MENNLIRGMKNKIGKWLLNNWAKLAEIAVVIWAIKGMWYSIKPAFDFPALPGVREGSLPFYFLSSILILYLLKRYERKNP